MEVSSRSQRINWADSNRIYWNRSGTKPRSAGLNSIPRLRTHLRRDMNFSSAARLASMVTDRKRGSTRWSTADRSAIIAASRTCEEFWFWSRRRNPPLPEPRIHRRRRRCELATRSMTSDWAAARAHHFLRYFLVYIGQSRVSSIGTDGTSPAPGPSGRTCGPGPSADANSLLMEGRVRSQSPFRYHLLLFFDGQLTEKSHYSSLFCRNSAMCALYKISIN